MGLLSVVPFLLIFIYLSVLAGILYLIYTWVNKFITLKQEQNDLLREIIKKLEGK